MLPKLTAAFIGLLFSVSLHAQNTYSDYAGQSARLNALAKAYPQYARLSSIGKTAGGKTLWLLTLGKGKTDEHPAIAIVGGVEGNNLLGTEISIGFAENILKSINDSTQAMLAGTTFYIFPNMSPDATEQYFATLKYERMGNTVATDDDRDGKTNEDGYEDLDHNGRITMMRVQSPIGDYRINPDEPRSLIKADVTKGEKGNYLLFTEGVDNDKDGLFNEDGDGGVWFNKNFTFKHPSFSQGSGEFPVSETETRALLDELYKMFNVYAVLSFSQNNNLSVPYTYNQASASQRLVSGYQEQDAKVNAMVSDLYNKTVNMKDAPKSTATGGDLLSWAYYHYGRFSFSTPGWFIPHQKSDTAKKEKTTAITDSVAAYLRWAAAQGLPDAFTEWKKIDHPDFPNQLVEVGGIDPFVMINPPYSLVPDIIKKHTAFIKQLAALQPKIDITDIRTEKLGNGITRLTATVMNTGALPSHSRIGEKSYWLKKINVKLSLNGQTLLSGRMIQQPGTIDGYSEKELTWLIKGGGKAELEAGSPTTGTKKIEIML